MAFEIFRQYVIDVKNQENDLKHKFYKLDKNEVQIIDNQISLPFELKLFYEVIGYGFFFKKTYSFNRILAPTQVEEINSRQGFYEFDPDLELYDDDFYKNKLIFFEVNEGVYLLIDKIDHDSKNAVYYFQEKIADSLEEFLIRFDKEGHYFE